jgi:hypothetical protein
VARTTRDPMAPSDYQEAATPSMDITKDEDEPVDLSSCMLLLALKFDPRPTLVLDLDSVNISFLNPALESRPNLCETLRNTTINYGSPTNPAEPHEPIILHGLEWDHYTIGRRWKVMSASARSPDIPDSKEYMPQNHMRTFGILPEGRDSAELPAWFSRECEHFMNLFDWQSLEIGPMSTWQRQLQRSFVGILVDPRPACIYWGSDAILLYNEAFIPVLGDSKSMIS